ncbi:general transcription factor 3C polypeptide 5 [Diorhabda carinulata]|uniref:general transcription factor 3C polypeptide 5 n=1 Tax=Diorhabda carinulata TaxID=1163345 RepID=UPI0025A1EFA0|nr:general transcription factor 3C polypeptide 5 [Diorhabda carinulata]
MSGKSDIQNDKSKSSEALDENLSGIDRKDIYKLDRKFVRIEYPGIVKNVSKAIETLGGIGNIEMVISDPRKKLELRFHPDNKYNKPCSADRDNTSGLLVKFKKKGEEYDYEILGYVYENFKFNKAVDFQFLPIVQDEESETAEYIYDKMFPKKLPNLDFLVSTESASQPSFLLPSTFSRYETTRQTLYLNAGEKFSLETNYRPSLLKIFEKKRKEKNPYKQLSHIVNIMDPNLEIPKEPKELVYKIVKEKCLEDDYLNVKKLFDERPIWTKPAIQHLTGINADSAKVLLPAHAYYWSTGPFRTTWTKFGHDPRTNYAYRIYQTLDFRIRESEGSQIIIRSRKKQNSRNKLGENHYILSKDYIPPGRQMFYQYCDIKLPEIQEMLQRLPKIPGNKKFDSKNGWLPVNFSDQCREIANRYMLERVHQELLAGSSSAQSNPEKDTQEEDDEENLLNYSGRMLNMMKGQVDMSQEVVVLSDEEDNEQIDDISPQLEDDEVPSDNSEMELDMEALEEINQLISNTE